MSPLADRHCALLYLNIQMTSTKLLGLMHFRQYEIVLRSAFSREGEDLVYSLFKA